MTNLYLEKKHNMLKTVIGSLLFFFSCFSALTQSLQVGPYLQDAEPNSMTVMWETNTIDESIVEWGPTTDLGNTSVGAFEMSILLSCVHTVNIEGLAPETRYYYRVNSGDVISDVFDFKTPPIPSSEKGFNIVSMSDMQQDGSHPDVFSTIVNDELIPFVEERYGNDLASDLAYVFIPGDLVSVGGYYPSWKETFFDPAQALFQHVPVYPVAGNHEQNSANYFRYFSLPENGTNASDYLEHWYYKDYSNVRLIGLESNSGYRIQEQLDWLEGVLEDAALNENIDFVYAQLHHPHHSELWIEGNTDYTGDVIERLESFSTTSGKPSVHFFGHTHGYSRGQSRDHEHLMVNVASAGGAIDNWGEYEQEDYKEYSRSDDDYGFVLVEVEAGNDPQFLLTRVSHGSYENGLVHNEIRDTIRVRKNNMSPEAPTGLFPNEGALLSPDCILFLGSNYSDPDGQLQGATHWQISTSSDFSSLIYDDWFQYENWYYDVDLEAGNLMNEREISTLGENTNYYWRLRYRDRQLAWSDWSQSISFSTGSSSSSDNLLMNPGAEDNVTNWTEVEGSFESIASGECAGNNAHSGSRLFAVGAVCSPNAYGEGYQDIDVSSYVNLIESDSAVVFFGGYLSDYSGSDIPAFKIGFFDLNNEVIGTSGTYENNSSEWTYVYDNLSVPSETRTIRMVLTGTRNAGTDNDSYFDDLFVRIKPLGEDCEQLVLETGSQQKVGSFAVYPNPVNESFFIHSNSSLIGASFSIYTQEGVVFKKGYVDRLKKEIDFRKVASGVYFISVDGAAPKKIIKSF